MEIYKFALGMELDGEKYYRELKENAENEGLKQIFEMLAEDELRHYNIIKEFKENADVKVESSTLRNANNIFAQMLKTTDDFPTDISQKEAYSHACTLEEKSIEIYEQHKEKATSVKEELMLDKLILEEKKHKLILENIIEFITEPQRNRGVKTVNSDPEFARWDKDEI